MSMNRFNAITEREIFWGAEKGVRKQKSETGEYAWRCTAKQKMVAVKITGCTLTGAIDHPLV